MEQSSTHGMTWLVFAMLTVLTWGLYGVFIHSGQIGMGESQGHVCMIVPVVVNGWVRIASAEIAARSARRRKRRRRRMMLVRRDVV